MFAFGLINISTKYILLISLIIWYKEIFPTHTFYYIFETLLFQFHLNSRVRSYMNATLLQVPINDTIRKTQLLMDVNLR